MTKKKKFLLAGLLIFLAVFLAFLAMAGYQRHQRRVTKKTSLRTAPVVNGVLSDANFPKNFPPAKFPADFMWGVAASSYQTGLIGLKSDWW